MNTTVWDADFVYTGPVSVRVSCHSGDLGTRALCNVIGNQPLFYMEDEDEEDLMAELLSDGTLEAMQAKLHNYDRAIECLADISSEPTEAAFARMLAKTDFAQTAIKDILAYGGKSGLFASYVEFVQKQGIAFSTATEISTSYYDKDTAAIKVNPNLEMPAAAIALLQAMRTAWHHKQGILLNPLAFQPEETVLINRLFAADLDVTKVAFVWDMKLAGDKDIWNNAMSGSDYDLYTAYAIEAMADFRSIKSGLASRATFEKWFISDRCKNFDRRIIQVMLGKYACHAMDNQKTSRLVARDIVARLGNRPLGKNYLSTILTNIITDSLYTDVRDRSNANFLWFVTFERRMAEMEQELQEGESQKQTLSDAKPDEDNIHELPIVSGQTDTNAGSDGVATLFFLDHFRAG